MAAKSFDVAKLAKEKGNKAFQSKDYVTARLLYSQAMKIDPSQYIYPLNNAIANLKLERWRDAEADATTALKLAPDDLKALFRRGLARTELREWSLARQDIQTYLDGGGCLAEGNAVLDAIANFEISSMSNPISDKSDDRNEIFDIFPFDDSLGVAIRDSKVDGKGVFATRELRRGDTIVRERPLISHRGLFRDAHVHIEAALRKMSPPNVARFLSLNNAHTGNCCNDRLPNLAAEIFDSNLMMLTDGSKGVCFYTSQLNHSCTPNAGHTIDPTTGELQLYALGPIHEGEEIFHMYTYSDSQHMYTTTRAGRQAQMHKLYHFTCACTSWTLPDTAKADASDARRVRIGEIIDIFKSEPQAEEKLRGVVEAVRLFREEGMQEGVVDFMATAVVICAHHSDWASAKYWAEMFAEEFKEGSPEEIQDFLKRILQPTSLPDAGLGQQKDFNEIRLEFD